MAIVGERFKVSVFNKQTRHLAITFIRIFVINLILNKNVYAAFGSLGTKGHNLSLILAIF